MANPEHLTILKQGVNRWNQWSLENPNVRADFSEVNLSGAVLVGANFGMARLNGTNLSGANLFGANLSSADVRAADLTSAVLSVTGLVGADFGGANLNQAMLWQANLSGTNLKGANLTEATLEGAHFAMARITAADFTRARLRYTSFSNVDLSTAVGLEDVRHEGPSYLSVDSLYTSRGKIPEVFLRGCGVPEEFIAYIGSMVGRRIEYYSCFISYSTKDQAFADRLYADLQAKGVRCWFAPHDMPGGRKIHEVIDEAIRSYDKLLLILSEHSMASVWVGTEIANAREREAREKKQMLFPITVAPFEEVKRWKQFDADRGKDSAREIREYYIPDFSGWERDHADYQREFEKLVAALKAGSNP